MKYIKTTTKVASTVIVIAACFQHNDWFKFSDMLKEKEFVMVVLAYVSLLASCTVSFSLKK